MKNKIVNVLKYLIFAILFAVVLYGALLFSFLVEFNYFTVSSILGDSAFTVFFIILPIIAFVAPFAFKLITKCKFTRLILIAVISVLLYLFIYVGTHRICVEYCKSFTSEKWSKYPQERHYMFDDLTEKHNLLGMTRDELTALLGEPDALSEGILPENHAGYMFNSAFLDWENIVFVFEENKVSEWYVQEMDF